MKRGFAKAVCFLAAVAAAGTMGTGMKVYGATESANDPAAADISHRAEGDSAKPAEAYLSKKLCEARGITTPEVSFRFLLTPASVDGTAYQAEAGETDPAYMPQIAAKTVSFQAGDQSTQDTATGISSVSKLSGNVLEGIAFPHAGVYLYDVSEDTEGLAENTKLNNINPYRHLKVSGAHYRMRVYADNAADGSIYVRYVTVIMTTDDAGNPVNLTDPAAKIKPDDTNPSTNGFRFTNVYSERKGGTGEGPDAPDPEDPTVKTDPSGSQLGNAFTLGKTVTGNFINKAAAFKMSVTLKRDATNALDSANDGNTRVTGYLCTKAEDGSFVRADAAAAAAGQMLNTQFTVDGTTVTDIYLKHGQYLVFPEMEVGTTYAVTESGVSGYFPKARLITDSNTALDTAEGNAGTSLTVNEGNPGEKINYVAEKQNTLDFSNRNGNEETPMGITLNRLPYILMILTAALGFCLLLASVLKRRNNV